MKKALQQCIHFFKVDMWQISMQDVSPWKYLLISVVKKLYLAIKFFTTKGSMDAASALTYSTLLAIVPISAVVFAIARGFGYSKYIEEWFRRALSSQPQAADAIIGFVNSYLVHTKSGIILGIGLVFMLWTVLMLIRNIEQTINRIWQVKQERSMMRMFTDYLAMFFLLPVILILMSGLSIFMATVLKKTSEFLLLGPMMRFLIDLMPYVFMSVVFIAMYIFVPNTKVKARAAIVPGILAGVAMQLLQFFYINCQIFLSSYNAIYGSFAALPLFMLWVQISWTICLFGAELSYTNQNMDDFAFMTVTSDISHRYRMMMSALLLSKICKRFVDGAQPYTALQLKLDTGIPTRITTDLLYDLTRVNLITENSGNESDGEPFYQPAQALQNITVGAMIDRLESLGKWNLELDLHAQMQSVNWGRLYHLRKQYLDDLRQIPIKDL